MQMVIKNGRVLDPGNLDGLYDILINDGKILDILPSGSASFDSGSVALIDAEGKVVTPGLIDIHVHFRDPGEEYKETLESGSRAAAHGGFTAVCTMPNTRPVNDNRQVTEYIVKRSREIGLVRIFPVAAISKGLQGQSLCEYGELKDAGAVGVTDDGMPVSDSVLMRRALEYAWNFDLPVISHCEMLELAAHGAMNEGPVATRMGLSGIPNAAESIMVMRDIALAELTGIPIHIAHVSAAESVEAIRSAKKRGVGVTAETAPHYFTLTDSAVGRYDTHAKMNPPLRSAADRKAIIEGLIDGTIDAIATDHAPHSTIEKNVEFDRAANGIIGLETSLSLALKLVLDGHLTLPDLIAKMTRNPAGIMGLDCGIEKGRAADITIIDPQKSYTVDAASFQSISRNSPFIGWELTGKPVLTMMAGNITYNEVQR